MERKFRTVTKNKTWKYKDTGCVFNHHNGIVYISNSNTIILKIGFKPIKKKHYIDIVRE